MCAEGWTRCKTRLGLACEGPQVHEEWWWTQSKDGQLEHSRSQSVPLSTSLHILGGRRCAMSRSPLGRVLTTNPGQG